MRARPMFDKVRAVQCDAPGGAASRCETPGEVGVDEHIQAAGVLPRKVVHQARAALQVPGEALQCELAGSVRQGHAAAELFRREGDIWAIESQIVAARCLGAEGSGLRGAERGFGNCPCGLLLDAWRQHLFAVL